MARDRTSPRAANGGEPTPTRRDERVLSTGEMRIELPGEDVKTDEAGASPPDRRFSSSSHSSAGWRPSCSRSQTVPLPRRMSGPGSEAEGARAEAGSPTSSPTLPPAPAPAPRAPSPPPGVQTIHEGSSLLSVSMRADSPPLGEGVASESEATVRRRSLFRRSASYDASYGSSLGLEALLGEAAAADSSERLHAEVERRMSRPLPELELEGPHSAPPLGRSRARVRLRGAPSVRRWQPAHRRDITFDFRAVSPHESEVLGRALPPSLGRARADSLSGGSDYASLVRRAAMRPEPNAARCSAQYWTDAARARDVGDAVKRFNAKPRDGLELLRARGLLAAEPPPGEGADAAGGVDAADAQAIATFLHAARGLSKQRIGDFLGEPTAQSGAVLKFYTQALELEGLPFVGALRAFLTPFRLPGEAQKIDRIMQAFSAHYHTSNPAVFSCEDTAYVFAFSLIMLNTDAHSTHVQRKMTEDEFVRNNRGIDRGADLPAEVLRAAYADIRRTEIKTTTQFEELTQAELLAWLAQGSVFTKYTHGRVGAVKSPRHEIKLWIERDTLCYVSLSRRSGLEKAVGGAAPREKRVPLHEIREVLVGANSVVLRRRRSREGQLRADLFFSLVTGARTLDLHAGSPELADFWVRYFRQVVERSRLEATARRIALRAQPREAFVEMAERVWAAEILPAWEAQRGLERTRTLWWEGVPPSQRGHVWLHALGAHPSQRADAGGAGGAPAAELERLRPFGASHGAPPAPPEGSALHGLLQGAGAWLDSVLPRAMAELFSLYGQPSSPLRRDALALLGALASEAAEGGRPEEWVRELAPDAPLLGGMLLIHLEPALAYRALRILVLERTPGGAHAAEREWRNRGFTRVLTQELPALEHCLSALGVPPGSYFSRWLRAMFVHVLPLETCSRLWDCYFRDGEALLWRAALELLRLRAHTIIGECSRDANAAVRLLNAPVDPEEISEARLFKSMHEHEGAMSEWLPLLQQRLPLPELCFDLHANAHGAGQRSRGTSLSVSDAEDTEEGEGLEHSRLSTATTETERTVDDDFARQQAHAAPMVSPGAAPPWKPALLSPRENGGRPARPS